MNRAARRRAGRYVDEFEEPVQMVLTVEEAIRLNTAHPIRGMQSALYAIRAEFGPDRYIGICSHCDDIMVMPGG